jgi:HEPN domain-containing protein/predicted nucleotidyltransferase
MATTRKPDHPGGPVLQDSQQVDDAMDPLHGYRTATGLVFRGRATVTGEEFRCLIERVAQVWQPERIILFGSYAYGKPTPYSDVDLLVVADTSLNRADRRRVHVDSHPFQEQILVRTPEEVERALAIGDFFLREIITQGQVVYEHGQMCAVDHTKVREPLDLSFPVGGEVNEVTDPMAWIALAEGDYRTARWALRRVKEPDTPIACFHVQQCIEKYLKAALVSRGQGFPKVHDLAQLNDLAEGIGIFIPLTAEQMKVLNKYAVEVRYPGNEPTIEDARAAYELARGVRRYVRRLVGLR